MGLRRGRWLFFKVMSWLWVGSCCFICANCLDWCCSCLGLLRWCFIWAFVWDDVVVV